LMRTDTEVTMAGSQGLLSTGAYGGDQVGAHELAWIRRTADGDAEVLQRYLPVP
jgi:hypothetical protein